MPQQLIDYRKKFGEEDENRVGKWLVNTLIWLPLLIPSLALGLEWLPHSSKAWLPETYLWISGGLVGCWLLVGWLVDLDDDRAGFVVIVATVVGFAVGFVVAVDVGFVVAFFMVFFMASFMAVVVAFFMASFMASFMANMVARFMAGSMAVFVANGVANGVTDGVAFIVTFVVAGSMAIFMPVVVADGVEESLKTGTPSWLARLAFLLLIVAHLFLIYFCFLGGWRLFV